MRPRERRLTMADPTSLAIVVALALGGGGREGLSIVGSRHTFFRTGPFPWYEARDRTILHFTARDRRGGIREGWASCAVLPWDGEPVRVEWVEEPETS